MRWSDWRRTPRGRKLLTAKVGDVVEGGLRSLTGERDPETYIVWGDDDRFLVLAATPPGLVELSVRANVPGEGPRAGGKLVRWSRIQMTDATIELQQGHRHVAAQLEGQVLRGVDEEADLIAAWVALLAAYIDGRAPVGASVATGSVEPASRKSRPSAARPARQRAAVPRSRRLTGG